MNDLATLTDLANSENTAHPIIWLEHQGEAGKQKLGLVPAMGGSVVAATSVIRPFSTAASRPSC